MRRRRPLSLVIGLLLLMILAIGAVGAPILSPAAPDDFQLEHHHEGPSIHHLMGYDENGCDVLAQVIYGARVSLLVAISVVAVSVCIGLTIGTVSGYYLGWVDQLTMRFVDLLHAFPGFLLALAIVAVMGPSATHLVFAMCITGWTGYARLVRGEVMRLKHREHVQGAIAVGATTWWVVRKHLWPNLFAQVMVQATFGFAGAILTESGLSFLGLGASLDTPTWGSLLNSGRRSLLEAPHISLFAGLAILVAVLSLNLIGNGLQKIIDPRST